MAKHRQGGGRGMTFGAAGQGSSVEQSIEPHIGCMAGLRQLFDRHHVLAERRRCPKHLLPSTPHPVSIFPFQEPKASYYSTSTVTFRESYAIPSSPEPCPPSPESRQTTETPPPRSISVFGSKDGGRLTWRFRDSPRLSLDSHALAATKGELRLREIRTVIPVATGSQSGVYEAEEQRRSPSVVARLIGINALPSADSAEADHYELRRSASESRVWRDPSQCMSLEPSSFTPPEEAPISAEGFFNTLHQAQLTLTEAKKLEKPTRNARITSLQANRFVCEDFFLETKRSGELYSEIERRLRMRGINEPAKDLETLKQILEALQLQGLFHSKQLNHRTICRHNLMHDFEARLQCDSPVVNIKKASKAQPELSIAPPPRSSTLGQTDNATGQRYDTARHQSVNRRSEMSIRAPSNAASQRQLTTSSIASTKFNPNRTGPDPTATGSSASHMRKAVDKNRLVPRPAEDDAATTFHVNSIVSSPSVSERPSPSSTSSRDKPEFCGMMKEAEQVYVADQKPSPISVLDSSPFLANDGSPSPFSKRCIDFKDQSAYEWEEPWRPAVVRTDNGNCTDSPDSDVRDVRLASLCEFDAGENAACRALPKCIAAGRFLPPAEISDSVLQIERMIFRDLVGETIRHLASSAAGESRLLLPRRKLVF